MDTTINSYSGSAGHIAANTAAGRPHSSQSIALAAACHEPTLTVCLLGPLRVLLNEHPIESWPSGRGKSLFKYLVAHRERPIAREVLMEQFWPEAGFEAARNSLNVAIYGLRQAFQQIDEQLPVVLYQRREAAYQLNPRLRVWLDVEELDRHLLTARNLEVADQASAIAGYEAVASLYQGDFLDDEPYEEWPMSERERLRMAYLDTLDRLSQIYFSQGQYAAAVLLCQLLLRRDACHEDAHCRLMRCYGRQGQRQLAIRQYNTCVRALSDELGISPAATTTQLYERIRHHESV